jgi:cyanophycinase
MPAALWVSRRSRVALALLALLLCIGMAAPAASAPQPTRTLVPIGSDYSPLTLQRFAQAAVEHDASGNVYLLVLPITFATDAFSISKKERTDNLALANTRRGQVEAACNAVKRAQQTCQAVLAPILVRDDAYLASNLALFTPDLDGMYILGGDQTIAMQVVADTPTEQRMAAAYAAGAAVGGNSAGAAVESLNMIGGYTGDNGPENGLEQGSVDLWLGQLSGHRGLSFGLQNAVLDQHVFQRGRIGRLINTAWTTKLLGIGADAATAATIVDERTLTDVLGSTAAIVIDTKTYASSGRYAGPTNSLAISRVATHIIPAGGYGYRLDQLRPVVNGQALPAPNIAGRTFDALRLPAGYGPLLLGGDISGDKAGPVARRFIDLSVDRADARLVVLAAGYAKQANAQADAKAYAAAFQSLTTAPVQWFVLDTRADQAAIQTAIGQATGVFLTAPDQSLVKASLDAVAPTVAALRAKWQSGATLMADNAAASALGGVMTISPPPPSDTAGLEEASILSFGLDSVTIQNGLGFVPGVAVEPRVLPDRQWGQLYHLLYRSPQTLAIGIDIGTALELAQDGPHAAGSRAVLTLDGRYGSYSAGGNGALGARYVIFDSFVAGDDVRP